ncbi:MAG: vitamin K epoxide reductase family protein [Dehalococcoidia bacterium]
MTRARELGAAALVRFGAFSGLALAGMAVSAYLTYTHYADQPVACGGYGGCDAVQTTEYAILAGIPVALLGALFCAGLLAVALWWLARLPMAEEWAPVACFAMTLGGVAFAAYLTYVELFVLEAVCIWCVAFAFIVFAGWLVSLTHLLAGAADSP